MQLTIELIGAEAVLAEDVDQRARIDGTCAARHRDALERREAHRRVARTTVPNRGDGATAAQVADDEAKTLGRTTEKLRSPLRAPFDRQSVEAVPADSPVGSPALGKGVDGGLRGHGGVEGGVEDGDLRRIGQEPLAEGDAGERRCVVERRERLEGCDACPHLCVDDDGLPEPIAAVDDAVCDRVDLDRVDVLEHLDRPARAVRGDEVELEAGRARVDDEDRAHRGRYLAHRWRRPCPPHAP